MLTVPEGYRDAMAAGNRIHVKMEFENGTTLTDEDIDNRVGITITDAFNPDTDIHMGTASIRQLSTRIIITNRTRYIHWDSNFALSFGVEDGEGGVIWVYFGIFTGQRPKNSTTLPAIDYIAYDQMTAFNANADDWADTYTTSKSITTLLSEIATEVGIDIVATDGISGALSRTYANRWMSDNYTYRALLQNLAEVAGCYCRIGGADMDKCELVWFNGTTNPRVVTRDEIFYEEHADLYSGLYWDDFDELTWTEAETMTWNEVSGFYKDVNIFDGVYVPKVDGGVICRYPTNVKTGHIYQFKNNPVLKVTSSNKSSTITNILTPMLDRLNQFGGILPMKVECVGDLVTQAGDVIKVVLPEATVEMPIYYKTMKWNGFLTDTYETTAPDAL